MNDEDPFGPLEERLAAEAQRLLVKAGKPLFPALQSEFSRRRRRRRLIRAVTLTAAIVTVGLLMRGWNEPSEQPEQRTAVVGDASSDADRPKHPANSSRAVSSGNEAVTVSSEQQRAPGALMILIAHVGENGETEYLPGWYVPERVEIVDSADLSPAEQAAAVRLLGPEVNTAADETI